MIGFLFMLRALVSANFNTIYIYTAEVGPPESMLSCSGAWKLIGLYPTMLLYLSTRATFLEPSISDFLAMRDQRRNQITSWRWQEQVEEECPAKRPLGEEPQDIIFENLVYHHLPKPTILSLPNPCKVRKEALMERNLSQPLGDDVVYEVVCTYFLT